MKVQLESLANKFFQRLGIHVENFRYSRPEANGKVNAWLLAPPHNKPLGTVVYLHGTGNDCLYPQLSLFASLVKHNYRVFTFDLDGHGQGSSTLLDPQTIDSCLSSSFQKALLAFTSQPIHLVGHSLGGALALSYVARNPQPSIKSVTLIATPLHLQHLEKSSAWELVSIISPSLYRQFSLYGFYHLLPACGPFKRHAYPIRLASSGKNSAFFYIRIVAEIFDRLQLEVMASRVKIPTLLCYGEFDKIAPAVHGRVLSKSLSASELFVMARETHFTTLFSEKVESHIYHWIHKWTLKA